MKTHLYLIHVLSPLHAGTGQSVGAIDLPIARERPTGIPLVPGSSIKGAMRARYDRPDKHTIFGPDTENAAEFAGAVQFSDAHLLLLPVRSIAGTFAWVTSPYLLQRFTRDAKEGGRNEFEFKCKLDGEGKCLIGLESAVKADLGSTKRVILEDLDFEPHAEASVDQLARHVGEILFLSDEQWCETLRKRLCIVHDDVMSLLLETATEVVARIKLEQETKTVADGQLWYEEALPTESVLYGLVAASNVSKKWVNKDVERLEKRGTDLLDSLRTFSHEAKMVQLGGKGTVGRGMCVLRIAANVSAPNASGEAGAK